MTKHSSIIYRRSRRSRASHHGPGDLQFCQILQISQASSLPPLKNGQVYSTHKRHPCGPGKEQTGIPQRQLQTMKETAGLPSINTHQPEAFSVRLTVLHGSLTNTLSIKHNSKKECVKIMMLAYQKCHIKLLSDRD